MSEISVRACYLNKINTFPLQNAQTYHYPFFSGKLHICANQVQQATQGCVTISLTQSKDGETAKEALLAKPNTFYL